jgi:hypothetical protein
VFDPDGCTLQVPHDVACMAALCCALQEGKTPADVVCSQMSCDQSEATDEEQDPLRSSILLALADASLAQSAATQVRPCATCS